MGRAEELPLRSKNHLRGQGKELVWLSMQLRAGVEPEGLCSVQVLSGSNCPAGATEESTWGLTSLPGLGGCQPPLTWVEL